MERKKILLIDDNVSQLDLIQILVENDGFEVDQAIDGLAAIKQLAQPDYHRDLIVIDLMMPKISGSETVRRLRASGILIPIIAFTALDDTETHREAMDAGCNSILTKPCRPDILLAEIRKLLVQEELN